MNRFHQRETFSIIIAGFTSVAAQVVLMRELVIQFYGNELTLGTMLGIWLLWTAAGSGFLSRLLTLADPRKSFVITQGFIALLLPVLPLITRLIRNLSGLSPGEMAGLSVMLIVTAIALAPICLASGLLYTLACRIQQDRKTPGSEIAGVYMFEAVGAGAGGLIISLVMLRFLNTAQILIIMSTINIISVLVLAGTKRIIQLVPLIFILGVFPFSVNLQSLYDSITWKDHQLIHSENSIYGNIAITRIGEQTSFFQNGLILFTVPDRYTAEEAVHYAMLQHSAPETVLLVGGGLAGELQEILRYRSVQTVDYVLLDPLLLILAQACLPEEHTTILENEKVQTHHSDARRFIKTTDKQYDVIILNIPSPYTAQLNRFYTVDFFREAKDRLQEKGVIALQLPASENVITPELSGFLSAIFASLTDVFRHVVILPGQTVRMMASNGASLTDDPDIMVGRLIERQVETEYVREYYIPFDMSEERRESLQSRLIDPEGSERNTDFAPIAYFYDIILWSTAFSNGFKAIFMTAADFGLYHWILLIAVITFLIGIGGKRSKRTPILYSVFTVGFTEISLQIIAFLTFQIIFGFVFHQIAILIAAYMAGLALGSSTWTRENTPKKPFTRFRIFQGLMAVFPLFLMALFAGMQRLEMSGTWFAALSWVFALIPFTAGWIGGYQFPLANRLFLASGRTGKSTAGFIYSFDLAGSAIGAVLTSAFLIPILGIYSTLILLAVLNAGCLGVLLLREHHVKS